MDRSADPRLLADVLAEETGAADTERWSDRQGALVAAARGNLERVASAVLGPRFGSVRAAETEERNPREYFVLTDIQGNAANLWLDAIPMPSGMLSQTVTNTTSDQYIVQISDRLPSEQLTRVLAHEVGELLAVRDRSAQGLAPVRESLLEQGAEIGERPELSSQDHGRIGELNWLAGRAVDAMLAERQRTEARAALSAHLDRCGLRPVAPVADRDAYEPERRAARVRLMTSKDFLSFDADQLVD